MIPTAVVMNMYYTGLGIARSLGEHGVPVIGVTSQHRIYGNYTRYAKIVFAPDSRNQPEELASFLIELGARLGHRAVIFPTRDHDVVFLDRFRRELEPYFILIAPETAALGVCLDKWETYLAACRADVPTPKCWMIEDEEYLPRVLAEASYPCVLKPVSAYEWRQQKNWEIVGGRKAIAIFSADELRAEYASVARANPRALVQEMIPGADDCLVIAACYLDRQGRWVAGFNTQKLVQSPEGFGTGCIVQSADRPEVFAPAVRILQHIGFTGIAEVEFKWDEGRHEYRLIEINPRLWDQHRLGKSVGADLAYLRYCEEAGIEPPVLARRPAGEKWIAEDSFILTALRLLWRRDPKLGSLFRLARGRRTYAIWSVRDPAPFVADLCLRFLPELIRSGIRALWTSLKSRPSRKGFGQQTGVLFAGPSQKKSHD